MAKVPKYEAFSQFLQEQICAGVYPAGGKLPSERELAITYNIAHMTVNKALNGLVASGYLERLPSRGTFVCNRERCKHAVVVMSYKSDPHAIFPLPLQQAMNQYGFAMTIFDTYHLIHNPQVFLGFLEQQQPQLLLIEGYSVFPRQLLDSVQACTKVVFFHRCEFAPDLPFSSVVTDFEQAGQAAAMSVLANGRSRIGIVTGTIDSEFHSDKAYLEGAVTCLKHNGLQPEEIADGLLFTEAKEIELLQKCDAIIAVLDSYLIPLIRRARRRGIRIPEDLVLVGAKNSAWAESYDLTSYDVQSEVLVNALMRTALSASAVERLKIPVEMCYRHSCPNGETSQVVNQ